MTASPHHIPVLLDEVVSALAPSPGELMVDATFGAGGYTRALLERGARVIAFDRDPDAIAAAAPQDGLTLVEAEFSRLADEVSESADGVTMDVGGVMSVAAHIEKIPPGGMRSKPGLLIFGSHLNSGRHTPTPGDASTGLHRGSGGHFFPAATDQRFFVRNGFEG